MFHPFLLLKTLDGRELYNPALPPSFPPPSLLPFPSTALPHGEVTPPKKSLLVLANVKACSHSNPVRHDSSFNDWRTSRTRTLYCARSALPRRYPSPLRTFGSLVTPALFFPSRTLLGEATRNPVRFATRAGMPIEIDALFCRGQSLAPVAILLQRGAADAAALSVGAAKASLALM